MESRGYSHLALLTQVRHELIGSCYFAVSEGGKLFWLNGGI